MPSIPEPRDELAALSPADRDLLVRVNEAMRRDPLVAAAVRVIARAVYGPITEFSDLAVATATLTAPDDSYEYRVEVVDLRDESTVISLSAPAALEIGRKIASRARAALR